MTVWKTRLVLLVAVLGGVLIGAHLFSGQPAEAQSRSYRQCFFARQETVDVNNESEVAHPGRNRLVNVPNGWTVAGAGYSAGGGMVMLCR